MDEEESLGVSYNEGEGESYITFSSKTLRITLQILTYPTHSINNQRLQNLKFWNF